MASSRARDKAMASSMARDKAVASSWLGIVLW